MSYVFLKSLGSVCSDIFVQDFFEFDVSQVGQDRLMCVSLDSIRLLGSYKRVNKIYVDHLGASRNNPGTHQDQPHVQ